MEGRKRSSLATLQQSQPGRYVYCVGDSAHV